MKFFLHRQEKRQAFKVFKGKKITAGFEKALIYLVYCSLIRTFAPDRVIVVR